MRHFILTTTGARVQGPGNLNPADGGDTIKFATGEPLEVMYLSGDGTPELLPSGILPFLGVKQVGHYDDVFIVKSGPLAAPGDANGFYTGTLDCNKVEFANLLQDVSGSAAVELDSVPLMAEWVYPVEGSTVPKRSRTFGLTGVNRVVTGNEGVPTSSAPPYPAAARIVQADAYNTLTHPTAAELVAANPELAGGFRADISGLRGDSEGPYLNLLPAPGNGQTVEFIDGDGRWYRYVFASGFLEDNGNDFVQAADNSGTWVLDQWIDTRGAEGDPGDAHYPDISTRTGVFAGSFRGPFYGNGSQVSNLNASALATGTVPTARLPVVPISQGGTGTSTAAGAAAAIVSGQAVSPSSLATNAISARQQYDALQIVFFDGGGTARFGTGIQPYEMRSYVPADGSKFGWTFGGTLTAAGTGGMQLASTGLNITGSLTASGPIKCGSFTVATVPSAASNTGADIYVSNESGGAVKAFSDGTNWRRVTDRAVIS